MIKKCNGLRVTSHALDPHPPVTNCHTFSDPFPLERDVLYGRPLGPVGPKYLRDHIRFPLSAKSHRPLRSFDRQILFVSRVRTTIAQN